MMKKSSFPCGIEGFFYVEIPTPALSGGESILFVDERGIAWLSRVEYLNDSTDALMFSMLKGEAWSAREEIARGSNWFVNQAALISHRRDRTK